MQKFKLFFVVLATVMISAISFNVNAQAGHISDFYAYKSCVDDSECDDGGYCVNGKCKEAKDKKGCVDYSDCGDDGHCVNGKCIKKKEKKRCVNDSECGEGGYCADGECQETKRW